MNRLAERIRYASEEEDGFTLIELLVVMLILGNLAAIALPAFYNQKGKAYDAKAKVIAHAAQVAIETCATGTTNGAYTTCNTNAALRAVDPTIPSVGVVPETPAEGGYKITVTAVGGNTYSVARAANGTITYPCTVSTSNRGGCPGSGIAAGTWG